MREIKFRAWDTKAEEFYVDFTMVINLHENGKVTTAKRFILMQYTGLKDKNGVEIYEGDILSSKNDGADGCDVWGYSDIKSIEVKEYNPFYPYITMADLDNENSIYHISRIEVIGNIYENKELLDEK